jgi:DHA2 family methylenomycin A resistance protein-like MFS transporter
MTASRPARPGRRRAGGLAVAVLAGSQFLAVMSTTVVSVALPGIGAGLHASASGRLWIVDAYVIVYSALLALLPAGAAAPPRASRAEPTALTMVRSAK